MKKKSTITNRQAGYANGYFTGTIFPIYQAFIFLADEWFTKCGYTAEHTADLIKEMFKAAEKIEELRFVAELSRLAGREGSGTA